MKYPRISTLEPEVKLLKDGRTIELLKPIVLIDSQNEMWIAEEGETSDGASIPRFFWRLVGGPLSGKYRVPAIFHDVYCRKKTRPSRQVHNMFEEVMGLSGVPNWKKRAMYRGVCLGGPKFQAISSSSPSRHQAPLRLNN